MFGNAPSHLSSHVPPLDVTILCVVQVHYVDVMGKSNTMQINVLEARQQRDQLNISVSD